MTAQTLCYLFRTVFQHGDFSLIAGILPGYNINCRRGDRSRDCKKEEEIVMEIKINDKGGFSMSVDKVGDLGNIVGMSAKRSLAKLVVGIVLIVILGAIGAVAGQVPGAVAGAIIALILSFGLVINQEYERALVFRLGSFSRVLGPGLKLVIPFLEWVTKVDYRVRSENVTPQKVLTRDNVTVTVDAIVYYKVKKEDQELAKAILEVKDYNEVTIRYAQTKLRDLVGSKELDEILQRREEVAKELEESLDLATNDFGIKIIDVELQDVSIAEEMERAIAAQAEAERNRRAKIKEAKGELQAAIEMRAAADILGKRGYQLRTLETLDKIAQENATIVAVPAELMPSRESEEGESPVGDLVRKMIENIDYEEILSRKDDIF
jgi:regulator of protease activity HflC (stomatin/prohibitin superfamily)